MDKEKWSQLKEIFAHISEQSPSFRRNYLALVCGDNPELRREIEIMLAAHDDMPAKLNGPAVTTEISIPEKIGEYEVGELLGSGGMSKVCRATHPRHGEVALKIVPQQLFFHPETKARFDVEVDILKTLRHPSLCQIYEVVKSERVAAIAMQLLEGQNLEAILSNGVIALDHAVRIARDIADLLSLAHKQGIIHRDIKPSNVIIDPAGETYLIDFGIAKQLDTKLTRTGQLLGSPQYMSPEQWRGEPADSRSDIWSLGVLLYHMCVGEVPFPGTDHARIANNILSLNSVLAGSNKLKRSASPKLVLTIEKMLQKNPNQRQQSMDQVRDGLKTVMPD